MRDMTVEFTPFSTPINHTVTTRATINGQTYERTDSVDPVHLVPETQEHLLEQLRDRLRRTIPVNATAATFEQEITTDKTSAYLDLGGETLRLAEVALEVRIEPEANRKAWFVRAVVAPGQSIHGDLLKSTPRTLTLPRGEAGQVQVDSITSVSGGFDELRLRGHGPVPS